MSVEQPLQRDDLCAVIEGRGGVRRVPLLIHFWVHPDRFGDREPAVREMMARYPQDVQLVTFTIPGVHAGPEDCPDYRWLPWDGPPTGSAGGVEAGAMDERVGLPDWGRLDEVLAHWPDPHNPLLLHDSPAPDGRYRLGRWFFCLFERHWSLRGMANALTDYYLHPDEVHRLFRALTDFYLTAITRAAREQQCDGIWTSDDLGTQSGPFFSPEIFRKFFKPYYTEIFGRMHELDLHAWMHACGNVEAFIPDWIDAGLDVLHPIQKHTMDEAHIAAAYGPRLTVLAGLDVQQTIPWDTPTEVRAEVRRLLDRFWRPGEGRCILSAGNGINEDCSLESLEAFFNEGLLYGKALAARTRAPH